MPLCYIVIWLLPLASDKLLLQDKIDPPKKRKKEHMGGQKRSEEGKWPVGHTSYSKDGWPHFIITFTLLFRF